MADSKSVILSYLQAHPDGSYYLRELSRRLEVDAGNLSRDLKKMVRAGQLKAVRKGNQTYFSLSERFKRTTASWEEILAATEKLKPELVKLTQDLIRIPSVSGENPEEKIARFIERQTRSLGLKAQLVARDKNRPNVVIDTNPEKRENFLFLGHMDTVGIGAIDNWRYYPFSAHVSGGKIYGRGAADMKAGIACEILLLKLIKDLRLDLPFNVRLILVSNEEGGSTATPIFDLGMDYLIKEGWVDGLGAIYGYGGSYNVGIGHRGILRAKITTMGESVHTGSLKWQTRERGINAVTGMAEILLAIEKIRLPKTTHPSFPHHGNVITPGVMILHGGSAVSMVPDTCESVFEIRYLPGFPIRKIYHRIKDLAERVCRRRPGLKVNIEKFVEIPAISLAPEEKLVRFLSESCQKVYKNPVSARGTGPANESYMLIERGIPTAVFGPIGARAHSDDEFVEIHSLSKTLQVYLEVLIEFAANSG